MFRSSDGERYLKTSIVVYRHVGVVAPLRGPGVEGRKEEGVSASTVMCLLHI